MNHHSNNDTSEPEEDRLIYVDIEICHKINDKELPDTPVDIDDIGHILDETLRHAQYQLSIPPLTVVDINYISTSQYKYNNSDNFSTFEATITTYEESNRETLSTIIDSLDEYFSAQRPSYTQKNYTPISSNSWCKLSSISLPPVNNNREKNAYY